MTALFPTVRLRRLRQNPVLRDLIRETEVNLNDLILPIFIKGEEGDKVAISSMPGWFHIPLSKLKEEIEEIVDLKIRCVMLFGIPPHKDPLGSNSYHQEGIIQKAIRKIRKTSSELLIISDLCFCEYTDHGHCGLMSERLGRRDVDNDSTLELLAKQAVSHAQAGADVLSPSGMMDGVVKAMRQALDSAGFHYVPLLSHSVKYNTCLYGPFRDAAEGAPVFGDRSSHQMDPANVLEALREVEMDVEEGVDMLMVKPAHAYLDVIYRVKQKYPQIPLGAYHTSGEFGMIKAAAEKGLLDEKKAVKEILGAIRRAGADFIVTYYAKEAVKWGLV